jgi:molecular chaperone DnaJ
MPATKRDYYEILGIGRESDGEEVKRAFRVLARTLHPDVSEDSRANEKFIELAEAYEVLSKSTSRLLYDRFGYRGRGDFAAVAAGPTPFFDLGTTTAEQGRRRSVGEIHITQYEAERGTTRTFEYESDAMCGVCAGSGAADGASLRSCSRCGGRGRTRQGSTLSGDRLLQIETCFECGGRGRLVSEACGECGGSGRRTVRHEVEICVPPGAEDEQRLELDDAPPRPYAVIRVQSLRSDPLLVRCGAAIAFVVACLFLILLVHF